VSDKDAVVCVMIQIHFHAVRNVTADARVLILTTAVTVNVQQDALDLPKPTAL